MSEQVIRHRGGGRDENGKIIPAEPDHPLSAFSVAPGSSSRYAEREREGFRIAQTVYFTNFVDLKNADELTVRGERYQIIVNDWNLSGRGGMEVLCTRGQG